MYNDTHISLLWILLQETSLRNMGLNEKEYYKLLNGLDWMPASYENIANCVMDNGVNEMYHAIVNEDDIVTLFTIPNIRIFWCCRCHLVAKDGSTACLLFFFQGMSARSAQECLSTLVSVLLVVKSV